MSESIRTSPPHPVGIAARYGQVAGVAGSKPSTRRGRHVIPPLRWRSYHQPPTAYSPPTFTSCSRPASRPRPVQAAVKPRSEEHTSELQSRLHLVCRLLLEKKNFSIWAMTPSRVRSTAAIE